MNKRFAVVVVDNPKVRVTFHKTWRKARTVFENLVRRHPGARSAGFMEAWLGEGTETLAYVTTE